MQSFINWVTIFITSFLQLSLQGMFVLFISNKKAKWNKLIIFALINIAANELPRHVLPKDYALLFLAFYFCTLILSLVFVLGFRWIQSLLSAFILILLSTVVEYISISILKVSFQGFDLYAWLDASAFNPLIFRNMGTMLILFAVLVIYYLRININLPKDIRTHRVFTIIINLFLSAILIIPNLLFFESTTFNIPVELFAFNAVSVLAILILSTYNSIKHSELEIKRQEVEFQNTYINTLNDLINGLRGFKHELNNIISVIGGYLSLNDLNGLKKYYEQIHQEIRTINNISPLNSYIKDNHALYGLILSKISYCEIRDIKFDIMVSSKIEAGGMKIFDFCKVIGILLDNAIEAATDSNKKYVNMSVVRNDQKNFMSIEISNSFLGEIPIESIFNKDFTTKANHSGYGLWEVKRILSKYKDVQLKTDMNNTFFTQKLEFYY